MHDVIRINRLLARHGDFLSRIWEGEVSRVDEFNARAVAELKTAQIVIGDDEGNIRLARSYRELLERSIGRRGHYGASRSIGADLRRLAAVAGDAHDAYRSGDDTAHHQAVIEGCDIIWELSDTLDTTIRDYERILHEGPGKTGDIKARARRTQFHIDRLEELRQGMVFLTDDPVHEQMLHASCRDLRREFSRMIEARMGQAVTRITRVSNELTRLLLQDRDILAETRRSRAALELLRKVSDEAAAELMFNSGAFACLPAIAFAPLVDPRDEDLDGVREELALKAEPRQRRTARKVETVDGLIDADGVALQDAEDIAAELGVAFEISLLTDRGTSLREWLDVHGDEIDQIHAFEAIMTGILAEEGKFETEFVPPLDDFMSSRISDVMVRLAA
ncbi:hypothetical protein ACEUZ9_001108 [Paracoccus litorisediminis]|uniref:hypothetical protein n=1 Tax=Paracoccus litorisediminis TaxID=2006130 RepID=UPI0037308F59